MLKLKKPSSNLKASKQILNKETGDEKLGGKRPLVPLPQRRGCLAGHDARLIYEV